MNFSYYVFCGIVIGFPLIALIGFIYAAFRYFKKDKDDKIMAYKYKAMMFSFGSTFLGIMLFYGFIFFLILAMISNM